VDISKHVFHFTGAEALLSILASRELWASSIEFLNDKFDGQWPNRRLQSMSDHPELFFGVHHGFNKKHLQALQLSLGQARHSATVSFSRHPRSLPQFRMYCPPGGGYAIGFPIDYLSKIATIVECDYSNDALDAWCKSYLIRYCQEVAAIDSRSKTARDIFMELAQQPDLLDQRTLAGLRFKSDEFIHESEVRLCSHVQADRFRISRAQNFVIPYRILNLPNDTIDVLLVAGPSRDSSLADKSLSALSEAARLSGSKWKINLYSIREAGFRP
jgi:hypothetical protein